MSVVDKCSLPEGYEMVNQHGFDAESIIGLRRAAGWGTEENPAVWQSVLDNSLASIGVIKPDEDYKLVGMGFLAGNIRNVILCDLVVHPAHRGQGIAQAILYRRLEIIDQLGIPYHYTDLSKTNTLASIYREEGFTNRRSLLARAVRIHPQEQ